MKTVNVSVLFICISDPDILNARRAHYIKCVSIWVGYVSYASGVQWFFKGENVLLRGRS